MVLVIRGMGMFAGVNGAGNSGNGSLLVSF